MATTIETKTCMNQHADLEIATIPWAGGTYSGAVSNGVPDVLGKWTHPDGHKYIGEFKNGDRHGQGTYTGPDGTKVTTRYIEGLPVRWRHVGISIILGFLLGGPTGAALLGFVAMVVFMKPTK